MVQWCWDQIINICASQIPIINLQVDLNPRESQESIKGKDFPKLHEQWGWCFAGISTDTFGGQDYQQNSIIEELFSTTGPGDKLRIEYSENDIRHMKKLIEAESNGFAPLQRGNSEHWNSSKQRERYP